MKRIRGILLNLITFAIATGALYLIAKGYIYLIETIINFIF